MGKREIESNWAGGIASGNTIKKLDSGCNQE